MIGLLLSCLAYAAPPDPAPSEGGEVPAPPAEAPAETPAPPVAPGVGTGAPTSDFTPPVPVAPLVVPWPADMPAPADAEPVPVELEILVAESGIVEEITVKSGEEPFASLAVETIKAIRFAPAMEGGAPVAVYVPVKLAIAPPPINVEGVVRLAGSKATPMEGLLVTVGGQTVTTPTGVQVFPGGLYALPGANIGTWTRNQFAVLPEV
ncbi:MAG: energy transducer TonB, partial [Myxococcota bacterium]